VLEVRDARYIAQPLVGRFRPDGPQPHGRGLWLVHQVCDLVELRSSAAGTVVRVTMRHDAAR
jgi:anti-sigma regulatory factor (Ser/Thr protein kinase)